MSRHDCRYFIDLFRKDLAHRKRSRLFRQSPSSIPPPAESCSGSPPPESNDASPGRRSRLLCRSNEPEAICITAGDPVCTATVTQSPHHTTPHHTIPHHTTQDQITNRSDQITNKSDQIRPSKSESDLPPQTLGDMGLRSLRSPEGKRSGNGSVAVAAIAAALRTKQEKAEAAHPCCRLSRPIRMKSS